MRSRDCEVSIKIEYLRDLHKAYEEFLQDIARIIPVIRVNYEQFHTTDEMAEMIVKYVASNFYGPQKFILILLHREYAEMTSIRYVDLKMDNGNGGYFTSTAPSTVTVEQ